MFMHWNPNVWSPNWVLYEFIVPLDHLRPLYFTILTPPGNLHILQTSPLYIILLSHFIPSSHGRRYSSALIMYVHASKRPHSILQNKMTTCWFVYHNLQNFCDTVTYVILKLKTNPPVSFTYSNALEELMSLTTCMWKTKIISWTNAWKIILVYIFF